MNITREELQFRLDRMQAVQDCRNLMGDYSLLHTAYRNKEYCRLWANRDDCVLLMPWGGYFGKAGVEKCYLVDHGDRDDENADGNPQLHGGMFMHCMDIEIIEVAEDGMTARGIWLDPGHETPIHFIGMTGQLYFYVPKGTEEFGVKAFGANVLEAVKITLIDASGNEVETKDNITQPHIFIANSRDSNSGEIWAIKIEKPSAGILEDYYVQLLGIPPLVSCSKGALLMPVR